MPNAREYNFHPYILHRIPRLKMVTLFSRKIRASREHSSFLTKKTIRCLLDDPRPRGTAMHYSGRWKLDKRVGRAGLRNAGCLA